MDSRLPVQGGSLPRRLIEVIDCDGARLRFADQGEAHELLKSKRAEALTTKRGRIRAIRVVSDVQLCAAGSGERKTRYSHDHETKYDNVRGCWTLVRLPKSTRGVYTAVLDSCLAA